MKKNIKKIAILTLLLSMCCTQVVLAAPNPGESLQTWLLAQLKPCAVIITLALMVLFLMKKNYVKMLTSLVIGGVVVYLISTPGAISKFGSWMFEILGLGN